MTEQEQRIAIAEVLGWKWYRRPSTGPWADKPMRALYHPLLVPEYVATLKVADMTERQYNQVFLWREGNIPDYLHDFNAMRSAIQILNQNQLDEFGVNLGEVAKRRSHTGIVHRIITSTAAEWAEAFLLTISPCIASLPPSASNLLDPGPIRGISFPVKLHVKGMPIIHARPTDPQDLTCPGPAQPIIQLKELTPNVRRYERWKRSLKSKPKEKP